ncbi:6-phosphofructokinase [Conglomerata obtusa]
MTQIKIKKFHISGKCVSKCSGDIYRKIGLKVRYKKSKLIICSTEDAKIKSIEKYIHVHIYNIDIVRVLMEEGFCRDDETNENVPLEMIDELGNKIIASFIPKTNIRKLAVLTSGGDAPGMNGAIRAIVRTARKWGSTVYGVSYGYDGLIKDSIEELSWDSVGYHSSHGGTFLKSARSTRFLEKAGRKEAVYNLVKRGVDGLIVLGGDGSIKGSMLLRSEFKDLLNELIDEKKVTKECSRYDLKVIAIPASIDNDISNSDMTLGADSALHRVIESVDNLSTTMSSHQRCFVIEVMGRSCGWIALMSYLTTGADYVMMPETPSKTWKEDLINSINLSKDFGKKGSFIIVSEGAIDYEGNKIDINAIKELIVDKIGMDTRVMKLGHVQRGGSPSAFDRIMSTIFGCKAVEHMLSDQNSTPLMIGIKGSDYITVDLQKVLDDNERIVNLQNEKKYEEILFERGKIFNRAYKLTEKLRKQSSEITKKGKIAIIHEGSRAGGMNVALHMITRYAQLLNQDVYVIQEGLEGLLQDQIIRANPFEFIDGIRDGGSLIGSSFSSSINPESIYKKLNEHEISSLIVIGSADVLTILNKIKKIIKKEQDKNLNIILLPATIDNSIPYTDMCLGADTALNCMGIGCDFLRLSSMSMKETVFVIEVPGVNSGYLALMGGVAAGAFDCFIPERKYMISHLSETAQRLKYRFKKGNRHGIILVKNQSTFKNIGIDSFSKILTTDSEGLYDVKYSVLGYLVEGGYPSPFDRISASFLAVKSVELLLNLNSDDIKIYKDSKVGMLGFKGRELKYSDIEKVYKKYEDIKSCKSKPRWMKFSNICRSME